MINEEREERHSRALEPELLTDPIAKAEAEALNGLRQYDFAIKVIQEALDRGQLNFKLRLSLILNGLPPVSWTPG